MPKLVSGYREPVRLIGVRCGGFRTDFGSFYEGRPNQVIDEVPVMCFAVETSDGVMVFDTGVHEACCDARAQGHFGRLLETFELTCSREMLIDARLQQAGYSAQDIRWVSNSHLHFDHAGGNHYFPGAMHLVRERERQFARTRLHRATGYVAAELDLVDELSQTWDYDQEYRVTKGVTLRHLPGHTPWHQSLEIEFADNSKYLCIGDAAYNLESVMNLHPTGYVADMDVMMGTLRHLKSEAESGTQVLSAHDFDQWHDVEDIVIVHEG